MKRNKFLYAVFASFIIFAFFNVQELDKAKASLLPTKEPEHGWILHQWVVAEAYDPVSGKDLTEKHASEVWQFLQDQGFVLFNNQIIEESGEWELKNGLIRIQPKGEGIKIFTIEIRSRNELLLLSKDLKVRLLKLDDDV